MYPDQDEIEMQHEDELREIADKLITEIQYVVAEHNKESNSPYLVATSRHGSNTRIVVYSEHSTPIKKIFGCYNTGKLEHYGIYSGEVRLNGCIRNGIKPHISNKTKTWGLTVETGKSKNLSWFCYASGRIPSPDFGQSTDMQPHLNFIKHKLQRVRYAERSRNNRGINISKPVLAGS